MSFLLDSEEADQSDREDVRFRCIFPYDGHTIDCCCIQRKRRLTQSSGQDVSPRTVFELFYLFILSLSIVSRCSGKANINEVAERLLNLSPLTCAGLSINL